MLRYNIEYVKDSFNREGYTLVSEKYINTKTKLDYISPSGYKGSITFDKWLRGQRHPKENKLYFDIDKIKSILKDSGFIVLNKSYKGSKYKIYYKCLKCNTINSVVWNQWYYKKNKCKGCLKNNKLNKFITNIEKENYIYKSGIYNDNRSLITLVCSNNHIYKTSRFNWSTNGSRCPKCNCFGTSIPERDIMSILSENNIKFEHRSRSIIDPYELDIIIPSKKIAIEYCGLYWHSDINGKDRYYHINKLDKCIDKGYRLITIFEDEWLNNKHIVLSRLFNILGIINNSVYARKTEIKEIESSVARNFCENNHLQGYAGSNIKLGLFYKKELISVMTFSKPSISKGAKDDGDCVWELNRFCSKVNYVVVGGASKLFSYFKNNYKWNEIFSYADRRWSDGSVYKKLGFNYVGKTPPNYWYTNDSDLKYKRIHRFSMRKKKSDPVDMTEIELRHSEGYYRIWDCGNFKYSIKKED